MSEFTVTHEIHADAEMILYRGHRCSDQARIALKRPRSQSPGPREIEKLRYEHAVLRELDVPGVIKAYGVADAGGSLALILEDPGPRLLAGLLRERRLDLATALRIAASVAEILEGVHRRQVIHKDVNPCNIAVDEATGEIRLLGFGLAIQLSQEDQRSRAPSALEGRLAYISPEQTGRMNRALDRRTDLYSLGVTLYEMLTGRLPFAATDPVDLVHSHIARLPDPPSEVDPGVPAAVSDIAMKLLAKAAEDRYQSARGLARDLRECLSRLEATGAIEPFPLGGHDVTGELRIPQRLYGRDEELAALLAAFERARAGGVELLLVAGPAGVGKSSLVNEIHKPIALRGGLFLAGKFEELGDGAPYAPIVRALRELARDLLASPRDQAAALGRALDAALFPIGQVLVELVPELGHLLGPQPPVPALDPAEAQNRFHLAFQGLLGALATPERPLVLFLDDLQWADAASLELLTALLTAPRRGHVLVVGAYREGEVDAAHPLTAALTRLEEARAPASRISVGPLDAPTVTRLLADALECDAARAAPLGEILFATTQGNPFFIGQLLRALHRDGLVAFDEGAEAWAWDLDAVSRAGIAESVVAFMSEKVRRLPEETQRALMLAASIGHAFDLRTLAIISERSPREAAAALRPALREGLVAPLDADYRFLLAEVDPGEDAAPSSVGYSSSYRFAHDRVQQAAYALIGDAQRREVHLRIGRLMRASSDGDGADLFALVRHLDLGASLIADREERLAVARLNLRAGRLARQATAYELAARTFAAGLTLAGPGGWEDDDELTLALTVERAECEYLAGRFGVAEGLFDEARRRARTRLTRARIDDLRVVLYCGMANLAGAVAVGRRALAELGVELPEDPAALGAALGAALADVEAARGGRRIEELLDAPAISDPEQAMALRLLCDVFSSAYVVSPLLLALVATLQASLSLRHGHAEVSPFGYVSYGFVLSTMGRHAEAYEWGRLALALNERIRNRSLEARLRVVFGMSISHCQRPLRESIPHLVASLTAARAAGDLNFLCYGALCLIDARLGLGEELDRVAREIDELGAVVAETRSPTNILIVDLYRQFVAALTGRTRGLHTLADDSVDEASLCAAVEPPHTGTARCLLGALKARLLLLAGDPEGALAAGAVAESAAGAATGYWFLSELPFHLALADLLAGPAGAGPERAERIAARRARLAGLAAAAPDNFRHKELLVAAEQAREDGDRARAIALYDEAIQGARAAGFVHDEALSNELSGLAHLAWGHPRVAQGYLAEASARYRAWGATEKAHTLEAQHADLLVALHAHEAPALDVLSMIVASQALSAEVDLDRLITRLMTIALENAGAERGVLLRAHGGALEVEAEAAVERHEIVVRRLSGGPLAAPGAPSTALPLAILGYVRATQEGLVLDDAAAEPRFAADEYVARARPRSVMCLPLLRQGSLVGVLYLENNLTAGAFPPERRSLVEVLAAQAGISLENGALYARLTREIEERRRAEDEVRTLNRELEQRVRERTAQLEVANKELEAFSYSVSHDLRSPLRAIDGFSTALLRDHGGALSEEGRELLERVRRSTQRMSDLIDDMLHLSRVTRAEMRRQAVDVSAMAREVLDALRAAEPDRELTCVVADGIMAHADAKLLRIALENLLGNAVKFTRNARGARVEVGVAEQPDGGVAYFVRDNGAGFDMRYAAKLFGAFQRLHRSDEFEGTGIGLATVRRIVGRHGGKVWADAAPGQGATFYFTL